METQELTQIVTTHQQVLARHEQWQADHEAAMRRHDEAIIRIDDQLAQVVQLQQAVFQAIALNREDIAQLTANIESLRNQVSDWMSDRNQ